MRKLLLAAAVAVLGCGGEGGNSTVVTDYTPNFVGRWDGTSVVVLNGQSINSPGAYIHVFATGTNALSIHDVCRDGSGPSATVTDANDFTMVGVNCPAVAISSCSSVSFSLASGGTGSLANGQLTATLTGVITGCGSTYPITFTFRGTRTSTSPTAAADQNVAGIRNDRVGGNLLQGVEIPF